MANRDLEDVVDDEGDDECCDERKDEQAGSEDTDEPVDVALAFGGKHLAGDDFGASGKDVLDGALDGDGIGAVGEPDVDGIDLAAGSKLFDGGRNVDGNDRRSEKPVGVGCTNSAHQYGFVRTGVGEVADGVADRVPDAVGCGLVDHDLTGAIRRAPVFQRDSLETGVANVGKAKCWAAGGGDDVAVLVEELGKASK